MEEKVRVTSIIGRRQCHAEEAVHPLELDIVDAVVGCQWIWIEVRVGQPPGTILFVAVDDDAVAKYVSQVSVRVGAVVIQHLDHDIGEQRGAWNLALRNRVPPHQLVCLQVEDHDLRRAQLVDGVLGIHNPRVHDPQPVADVDVHPEDGCQSLALGRHVPRPVRVGSDGRMRTFVFANHAQGYGYAILPLGQRDEDAIFEGVHAEGKVVFRDERLILDGCGSIRGAWILNVDERPADCLLEGLRLLDQFDGGVGSEIGKPGAVEGAQCPHG